MADAIGIDAGSYKTVLACVKQRGIEIVLSETSGKWTPTIAAYTDQERLVGDAAFQQMKKNFKNTCMFFQRFLGLNTDCKEQLEEEKKFVTYKTVEMENKKVGFEVMCRGDKKVFTPEQIMGFYLKKVKTYFEKAGMNSREIVISVPSYASNAERQAYIDAAEIANIKCVRLINESTATALTYGFFRKSDLDAKKERIVTFVDFGHSKLTVTFASFVQGKMKILGSHSNKNLGARQIDYLLFELLGGEFAKKYGCDPRKNVRCRLRLLDAIEKVRKLLTSNKEADVHCEALMEDEDLHKHLTRADLEELMGPFISDFKACLEESLKVSGVTPDKIDFVELVGEATRIPVCIEQIKNVFGKETSRTLNSTDCIARGCALQAAMLSPNFQVANFEVVENNSEPISISYKFHGSDKVVTKELFTKGSSFPSTKSVTFDNKVGGVDLMVHYGDKAQIMEGLPKQIAQYNVGEGKKEEKTEKCAFTLRISNNIHNIACLDEAEFVQEWTEEEKIPIKTAPTPPPVQKTPPKEEEKKEGESAATDEKKDGEAAAETTEEKKEEPVAEVPEQKYEIKKRQKKNFSKIKFSAQSYALDPRTRKDFIELENILVDGDREILEMKEIRNTLEAYSYEMRNNLDSYGTWEKYLDEDTKKTFMAEISQVVDWIYGDGETAPKQEYVTRLTKFRSIGEPVKKRHFYYSELEIYYEQFEKIKAVILQKLGSIEHLTDDQKKLVESKLEVGQKLIDGVKADRAAKELYQDPDYNLDQIINGLSALKKETEGIFNLPPPKPKVEEKPATDEKMEDANKENGTTTEENKDAAAANDTEMKDESSEKKE